MSMNKIIHGAVRRDLARLRAALADLDEDDRGRAADLQRAFIHLDGQLTSHHEGEHEIAWPALTALGVDPDLITRFDQEHEAMSAALAETRVAMSALAASAGTKEIEGAVAAAERLETVTCAHLDHEESETEPVFHSRYDDPALVAMVKKFRGHQSIGVTGAMLAWLQDGAGPEERAGLRDNVPAPVVTIVGGLFGRRYRREIAPVWARR